MTDTFAEIPAGLVLAQFLDTPNPFFFPSALVDAQ